MSEERRIFTRLTINPECTITLADKNSFKAEKVVNISIGGCLLEIAGPFTIGEVCLFSIVLHHDAPNLEITAEILRSSEKETTLRFIEISPDNLLHLRNIIRFNAENPDKIEEEIYSHPGLL